MRRNEKGEVIITGKKASELFLLLSNARFKLKGKMKTSSEKYWKEFENVLGLNPNIKDGDTIFKRKENMEVEV